MLGFQLKKFCRQILALGAITPFVALASLSGSLSQDAINERMQPTGQVHLLIEQRAFDLSTNKKSLDNGKKNYSAIYNKNCKLCHASGLAGAPKFRNKKDWQTRISQGLEVMTQKAYQGFKAMPPKGNCLDCSEEDIKKTIEYMIETIN